MSAGCLAGRITVNTVPVPTVLSTRIRPPCSLTIPYETDRPRPAPVGLVVKNGSKFCPRCSGAIPCPVSVTDISIDSPPRVPTVRVPPSFMACTPFRIRFVNTCRNWSASAVTSPRPVSYARVTAMPVRGIWWPIWSRSRPAGCRCQFWRAGDFRGERSEGDWKRYGRPGKPAGL